MMYVEKSKTIGNICITKTQRETVFEYLQSRASGKDSLLYPTCSTGKATHHVWWSFHSPMAIPPSILPPPLLPDLDFPFISTQCILGLKPVISSAWSYTSRQVTKPTGPEGLPGHSNTQQVFSGGCLPQCFHLQTYKGHHCLKSGVIWSLSNWATIESSAKPNCFHKNTKHCSDEDLETLIKITNHVANVITMNQFPGSTNESALLPVHGPTLW